MRFEKFLFLLSLALFKTKLDAFASVDAAAALYNPNIRSMIDQDTAVPVEQKVKEYLTFLAGGAKPFWFTTGD